MSDTAFPDFGAPAKADLSRAVTAYEHAARLIEGRMAISAKVDGENCGAVARALAPLAQQLRECAASIGGTRSYDQLIREAVTSDD